MNFIRIYSNLLNHFIFVYYLLIEDYEQGALRKKWIFASFAEQFETDEKFLLINFISAYYSLLKHFIFAHFLLIATSSPGEVVLIEGYGKCALRKEPVIQINLRKSYR